MRRPNREETPPAACVGCGFCCLTDQCEVSHRLHGYLPRCPELAWDEGGSRYVCRLIAKPRCGVDLAPLFVGQGCCWRDNPWRGDVRRRG